MDESVENVKLETTATAEAPAKAPKAEKAAKAPKAPKAPEAEKAPKAPKAPKAEKAPKASKAPKAEKAPKASKAPKAEKAPKAPKAPKAEKPAKRAKRVKAEKPAKAPKAPKAEKSAEAKAVKQPMRHRVTFVVKAEPGQEVYLAGTFNDWSPNAKQLKEVPGTGEYRGILALEPGRYEYKFVINGVWEMDHTNPDFVSNGFNTFNSVLVVEA